MDRQSLKKMKQTIKRYCLWAMAFVVIVNLTACGLVYASLPEMVEEEVVAKTESVTEINEAPKEIVNEVRFARSAPIRIEIPKIKLDTTFVPPLGLNPDQTVSVPDNYTEVGWYAGGVTPGEVGSSVILGHVDSYEGPAVFYRLGRLEAGDEIKITKADGTIAVFVVESLERHNQDEFPTELVYGQVDYPGLRLVTCSGVFNRTEQKYSHNLVVFAKLKNI